MIGVGRRVAVFPVFYSEKSGHPNIIELQWAVLERRMRSRFPPSKSLKQLADVPIDVMQLETIQKFDSSILINCTKTPK